ncbi:DUF2188 domain-containing protein [Hyphobacterium sp.]|uniref:DUF2188 domain-containing protein n=1 Tax=Hyphobacterium sp. TaxID=2004662 RepID=UPI003BAC1FFD
MKKGVIHHVTPNINGGWSVRKSGASKAIRVFKNKDDAISFANRIARDSETGLFIHKRDGRVTTFKTFEKKRA